MLLPVFESDTPGTRVPWISLGLAALWIGVFAAGALGIAGGLPAERLGLRPDAPALPGALAFFALHADGVHLAVSLALLAVVGPALEDRWGPPFFAAFLALAIALQGVAYALATPDSERPLVGASAALAGLVAAATVRFLRGGLTLRAGVGSRASRTLWLPGFALPAIWLAGEVVVDAAGALEGATRGIHFRAHGAVALLGALTAGVLQLGNLEQRWLRRGLRISFERRIAALLARAEADTEAGRPEVAYRALEAALADRPSDPRIAIALIDAGQACGRQGDALARAARHVTDAWDAGRRGEAVSVWSRVVTDQPNTHLDTRLRLALAPLLAEAGHRRAAALTLRGELRGRGRDLSPGTALRIAELARKVHPDTAIEAAQRALRSDSLDAGKRARIEAMIRDLEGDPAQLEDLDLEPLPPLPRLVPIPEPTSRGVVTARVDAEPSDFGEASDLGSADDPRAIRLDPDEELAADPESADPLADLDGFALDPEEAAALDGAPRFTSCKVIEVVPRGVDDVALRMALSDGSESTLPLARVQAVALVAVRELGAVPVLVLDLLLNWNDAGDEPLKIARARSDRFDPLRELAATVCARSGAVELAAPAGGDPVRVFDTLADYQREVLRLGCESKEGKY